MEQLSSKSIDLDNLRRAQDEMAYDNENLRRLISAKTDELKSLTDIIEGLSENKCEQGDRIAQLERIIYEVEDKNRKLVELLNANMYNKAENYKERVLNKL